MRWMALFVSLLALAATGHARQAEPSLRLRVEAGRIELRAANAPVLEVLEQLSRGAGLELTVEGKPPQERVSAEFSGASVEQAVTRIFEGLGLNYAATVNGRRLLIIFSEGGGTTSRPAPAAAPVPEPAPAEPLNDPPRPGRPERDPEATRSETDEEKDSDEADGKVIGPPVPPRPKDVPTSPFIPYEGPLNPKAKDVPPAPKPGELVPGTNVRVPVPGETAELEGMGPGGVPGRQVMERIPTPPTPQASPSPRP